MNLTSVSGVKIYDLSQAKSSSLANNLLKGKRVRSYTSNKIDLLQDFNFPSYSRCVKFSKDGRFILASGGYKPRIKMFDLQEVSMKFERYCDADIIDLEILSEDFGKFVLLSENRTLEFHTKFGLHETVKLPNHGRSLAFDLETTDMYIALSTNQIQRFNLTEGRFRSPLEFEGNGGANCVRWNENHRLITVCGEDGALTLFDPRTRLYAARLEVSNTSALSVVEYMHGGVNLGVGDTKGKVSLFDLRSSTPWKVKQHMYETRIHSLCFTSDEDAPLCLSMDDKQIKGWALADRTSTAQDFNMESSAPGEMAQLCLAPLNKGRKNSGLLMATGNCAEAVQMFFVPTLGPAPNWARYLDSVTEELEMKTGSSSTASAPSFENFRFVTRAELEDFNMQSLIGSKELKPWMHGYFMENLAFEKIKAVMAMSSDPATVAAAGRKKKPKADERIQLQKRVRSTTTSNVSLAGRVPKEVLRDDRFDAVFTDPAFVVNESSAEFKLKHPNRYREDQPPLPPQKAVPKPKSDKPSTPNKIVVSSTVKHSTASKSFLDSSEANEDDDVVVRQQSKDRISLGKRLAMNPLSYREREEIVSKSKDGDFSVTFVPKEAKSTTTRVAKKEKKFG